MVVLDNVSYDKIKLLHELACLNWFIAKHCKDDASTAGDQEFLSLLNNLQNDLQKYTEKLQQHICTVTQ